MYKILITKALPLLIRHKLFLPFILLTAFVSCKNPSPFELSNPGVKPTVFYPDNVSRNGVQWNNYFARNGTQIFYTVNGPSGAYLVKQSFDGTQYGTVEKLPFDSTAIYSDVFANEEGNHLMFMATLPHPVSGKTDFNLWESYLENNNWTDPNLVSEATSGPGNESYPVLTQSGNIYFSTSEPNSRDLDIYVLKKGEQIPKKLPSPVTTKEFEGDCYVDPLEQYIIFAGFNRKENYGLSDLYISFKNGNKWSEPKNLGANINSDGYDGSPYVSPDGKYLVFTSSRASVGKESTYFNHYIMEFDTNAYR